MKKADIHSKLKNTVTQNKHKKQTTKARFWSTCSPARKYISGIFLQLYKFGFITRRSIHYKSAWIKIKLPASLTDRWDTLPYPVMGKSQITSRVPKPKSLGIKSRILTAKSQSQTLKNTRITDAKHPNRELQSKFPSICTITCMKTINTKLSRHLPPQNCWTPRMVLRYRYRENVYI